MDELTVEDFKKYKSPTMAFHKLSCKMKEYISLVKFSEIRKECCQHILSPGSNQLSKEVSHATEEVSLAISNSKDLDDLIHILINLSYWNWLNVDFMETMAICSGNPVAERTLRNFKNYVSALKLDDVLPDIPVHFPSEKSTTIKEKFNCDVKALTVGDILNHRYTFSYEVINTDPKITVLCSIKTGCLQLIWLIPGECALQAYQSALANVHKFDNNDILSVKIEYYPTIFSPKYSESSSALPGMYVHICICD